MACGGCGGLSDGIVGLTKFALGIDRADDATIKVRLDACRECPHASRNPDPKYAEFKGMTTFSRCGLCKMKCFIKAKTANKGEQCPDNPPRWLKAPPDAQKATETHSAP